MIRATFSVLWLQDDIHSRSVFRDFYNLPYHSCDVIFLGASTTRESYIAPEGFENAGVAAYSLSNGNQALEAVPYLIEEVEKTQHPYLYVIDIRKAILVDDGPYKDYGMRRLTDGMKFSLTRIKCINHLYSCREELGIEGSDLLDLYFGMSLYHSRWVNINEEDFFTPPDVFMGYNIYSETMPLDKSVVEEKNDRCMPLNDYEEGMINDLLEYLDEKGINAVFVYYPAAEENDVKERYNSVMKMLKERGYDCINIEDHADEIGLDYTKDMKNKEHVNVYGAVKITDYLSSRIAEEYEIPDRRNDPFYQTWEESYERFSAEMYKEQKRCS